MYLSLQRDCQLFKSKLFFYSKTDSQYVTYFPIPQPGAYFALKRLDGKVERYFLDAFDPLPPRMMLRRRIWQYCNYFDEDYWQKKRPKDQFPDTILILPDDRSKRYVIRQVKKIVRKIAYESEHPAILGT